MANLFQPSLVQATDASGNPMSGAKLYFYLTGTTTPATFYTDQAGASYGTNPMVSDSTGKFAPCYLDATATYRIKLTNAAGSLTRYDVDPVRGYDIGMVQTAAATAIAAAATATADAAQTAADRVQTGLDRVQTGLDRVQTGIDAASAVAASATSGAYPNSAATNVPRGLTQASVGAITAGSGGTNGTFALAWSSGNFSVNPTGTFTVAGGALTAVMITGPGLYIGASPTVPTPSFAASAGLGGGAAVALTAQFLVTSGQYYWVQSVAGDELDRYQNVSGTATAAATIGPIPTVAALTTAVTALSAATVANYTLAMKSAVGSGTLSALFDMDGPRTAYSGSSTVMTALTSLDANAYSLGLYGTIYSGTNPRPVYTAGRGIYLSSGAGFQTASQMLTDTSNDFAFLYAVDLNTVSSTVSLQSSLPAIVDGDLVCVNADRNVAVGLGTDVPIVQNCDGFTAAQLVNGYFKGNTYNAIYDAETYLFKATGTGGQRFEVRINHQGQLTFFVYDGTNFVQLVSNGTVVIGQSVLVFAIRRKGNVFSLLVNGQTVYATTNTTGPNVNALTQWYFNGQGRQAAAAQPVLAGIRHYLKGFAIANNLPDDAAFIRVHDTFAQRHGAAVFAPPRAARGVIVMGQSWTLGTIAVTDTWRHGPNNWDGQIRVKNASYAQESICITRDAFPNVFLSRDPDNPAAIGPWNVMQDPSGNQQASNSSCGGTTGENFVAGWAKQLRAHDAGLQSDWYLACEGVGGASIALLSNQTVAPLTTQLKSVTLAANDYYNKVLRQIVYHRDMALAKGQTYTVDLILWQQGHTDAGNAAYLTALYALYDRFCTDVSAITGQAHKPVLLAPQINYSSDGIANGCNSGAGVIDQLFLDMEDSRGTRPMFCIGPMYPYTNFIHPPRFGHRWAGEIFGLATTRILFDGESYGCCRPYAYTYSVGGTTIDIDYRVRTGRSLTVSATNVNNVYTTVSNSGYEFTDASGGGVTISSVSATSATRIRVTLSGTIGTGDTIRYTGSTHRTGNVADGTAVSGLYPDQDWTATFVTNEPPYTVGSQNDVRQFAAASTKVL